MTPAGVPNKPTAPTATRGDAQATVSWSAVSGNGSAVTGYTVTSTPGAKTCTTTERPVLHGHGLDQPHPLHVHRRRHQHHRRQPAFRRLGNITPQAVEPTPMPVPTPPTPTPAPTPTPTPTPTPSATTPNKMTAPKVVVRGAKVILKWKAAVPNGSAITRYLIDISKGKDTTSSPSTTKAVYKRLKPGRYRIRIAAQNAIGISPYSTWATVRIR